MPGPGQGTVTWLGRHERELVAHPIIVEAIRFGNWPMLKRQPRWQLEAWFDSDIQRMTCLTWGINVGLRRARLLADLRKARRSMSKKDSLVAATALNYNLTIVTGNRRDFEHAGV